MNPDDFLPANRDPQEWGGKPGHTLSRSNLNPARNRTVVMVIAAGFGKYHFQFSDCSFNQVNRYLDEEYYRVVQTEVKGAVEVVRWEQPTLVLIDGNRWQPAYTELLHRLGAESLTADIPVLIWADRAHAPAIYKVLLEHDLNAGKLVVEEKLDSLQAALNCTTSVRPIPAARPVSVSSSKELKVAEEYPPATTPEVRRMLTDKRLRCFTDVISDSWETMQLACLFAEHPDYNVNMESLWHYLGFETEQAEYALSRLSQAGYIEPLEFDTDDPLWAIVAFPEARQTLEQFAEALKVKEYRMALATLVLAREQKRGFC